MDRRSENRIPSDQPARISTLGDCPRELAGCIVNLSGSGLRITLEEAIPVSTLVKVECRDTLLLGEVCYCRPQGSGYAVGLQLEHALRHTEELARLAGKLREFSEPLPGEAAALVRNLPPGRP